MMDANGKRKQEQLKGWSIKRDVREGERTPHSLCLNGASRLSLTTEEADAWEAQMRPAVSDPNRWTAEVVKSGSLRFVRLFDGGVSVGAAVGMTKDRARSLAEQINSAPPVEASDQMHFADHGVTGGFPHRASDCAPAVSPAPEASNHGEYPARFDGACSDCGQPYKAGDPVIRISVGKFAHDECPCVSHTPPGTCADTEGDFTPGVDLA